MQCFLNYEEEALGPLVIWQDWTRSMTPDKLLQHLYSITVEKTFREATELLAVFKYCTYFGTCREDKNSTN